MSADDYARKYMSEGGLLYQSKARAPLLLHLLVLLPALLSIPTVVALATQPDSSAAAVLAALPGFAISLVVWLLFTVLRATVTKTHVHIQYGLFGPKIPLERIESCEAVNYDWKKYGGFGIRRGRDGSWAYNMMGDAGRAVRFRWRDASGETVTTLLSTPDPEGLVQAVERARAGGVRVDVADVDDVANEEEALREAEAELEHEVARARER